MKLLLRKLIVIGGSKAVTIPKEYLKMQESKNGYVALYILDKNECDNLRI